MYTPIHQWAEDDRPREKLQLKGKSTLSDSELLAILIGDMFSLFQQYFVWVFLFSYLIVCEIHLNL